MRFKQVFGEGADPSLANVPPFYPLKTPENLCFLVFSEGIKWKRWPEMRIKVKRTTVNSMKMPEVEEQPNFDVRLCWGSSPSFASSI